MVNNLTTLEALFWLSLLSPTLGVFLLQRRLSFYGDALAHAAVGGLGFVVFFGGQMIWLLSLGALASVLMTAALILAFEKFFRISTDLAMTAAYSGLLSLGLLLLGQEGHHLEGIFVGDLRGLQTSQLAFLRYWTLFVLGFIILYLRPIWLSLVDPVWARILGWKVGFWDLCFLALAAISVVSIIQAVGVILVAAFLVLPAASALAWARSFKQNLFLSWAFAMATVVIGWFVGGNIQGSLGPLLAMIAFSLFVLSHLCALVIRRRSDASLP